MVTVFMYAAAAVTFVVALVAGCMVFMQADEITRLKAELAEAEGLPLYTASELAARRAAVYSWADAQVRRQVHDVQGGQR
jgi:hypothetical protein